MPLLAEIFLGVLRIIVVVEFASAGELVVDKSRTDLVNQVHCANRVNESLLFINVRATVVHVPATSVWVGVIWRAWFGTAVIGAVSIVPWVKWVAPCPYQLQLGQWLWIIWKLDVEADRRGEKYLLGRETQVNVQVIAGSTPLELVIAERLPVTCFGSK